MRLVYCVYLSHTISREVFIVLCAISRRCSLFCDSFFFFQAEDGIRDLVRSRGLGDVYKRQVVAIAALAVAVMAETRGGGIALAVGFGRLAGGLEVLSRILR